MKKQKNNIPADRVAIAPYNFVPLPDQVIAFNPAGDHSSYVHHTGQIVCKLTTETDLYIRGGLTASEFAALQQNAQPADPFQNASLEELIATLQTNPKNKPQFFSTANSNQPVIPASSLRGMIRSLVEIASFSKVGWVSDRKLIFRTIGDKSNIGTDYRERLLEDTPLKEKRYTPKTEAGYIELDENNNWCIRPARKVQGCSFTRAFSKFNTPKIPDRLETTQFRHVRKIWYQLGNLVYRKYTKVEIKYFNVQDLSPNDKSGFEQGYIVYSGNMGNKKSEALVFPLDGNAQLIEIPHDLVQIYRDQLSKEAIALLGDQGVLQDGCPVFYLIENGKLIFFGHNQMLRLAHRSSPKESIPHEVNDDSLPDLAEAIFGHVRQTDGGEAQALAGRVFFSNAHLAPEQGDVLKETQIPQILASPKPTTFQHYLVQENVNKDQLDHYSSQNATIRGRKLYWHQPTLPYMQNAQRVEQARTQYTCITPVNPGTTFEFTIRFENLSAIELGALLWVLDLASCSGKYRFKLGMGKPLGLGSVAINYELQLSDRKQRYQNLFDDDGNWKTGTETASTSARTKIIDAFRAFIDDNLDMDIEETEQIQQLRALLAWRGGAGVSFEGASALRYMEIERNTSMSFLPSQDRAKNERLKINEYGDRRVLPLPTQVAPPPPRELPRPPIADDPIKVKVIEIIGTKVIVQSPVYPNIRIEVDNDDGKSMKLGFTTKVIITEYADNNLVKAKWAK